MKYVLRITENTGAFVQTLKKIAPFQHVHSSVIIKATVFLSMVFLLASVKMAEESFLTVRDPVIKKIVMAMADV